MANDLRDFFLNETISSVCSQLPNDGLGLGETTSGKVPFLSLQAAQEWARMDDTALQVGFTAAFFAQALVSSLIV